MFTLGFEFEFIGPENTSSMRMRRHLRETIGKEWIDDLSFEEDTSIRFLRSHEKQKRIPRELITKPLPEHQALEQLKYILVWMQGYCLTDYTCGLHVNISFKNKELMPRVSYPRLTRLLPQRQILKMFDRQENKYCREFKIKSFYEEQFLFGTDKCIFVVDRNPLSKTKRYFEFRPIGNTDYQFRIDEIMWCIDVFKDSMQKAID